MSNKVSKGNYGIGGVGVDISNQNLLDYSNLSGFYTGINCTNEPYSGKYWFYTISGGVHWLWSCIYAQAYASPEEFYVAHVFDSGGGTKSFTGWRKIAIANDTQIQVVSRAGTGSDSSSNPCSITFSYAPSVVFCLGYTDSNGFWGCDYSNFGSSPGIVTSIISTNYSATTCFCYYSTIEQRYKNYVCKSSDGKTIYWYHAYEDINYTQMNESGKTFYFVGFH